VDPPTRPLSLTHLDCTAIALSRSHLCEFIYFRWICISLFYVLHIINAQGNKKIRIVVNTYGELPTQRRKIEADQSQTPVPRPPPLRPPATPKNPLPERARKIVENCRCSQRLKERETSLKCRLSRERESTTRLSKFAAHLVFA